MNAWLWFVIAAVAGVAGVSLLMLDRGQSTSHNRERRRWAGLRGWNYSESEPGISGRWQHGVFGRGVTGTPRGVVAGSLFTAAGKRVVHVFDVAGPPAAVIVAVQRRAASDAVLELWLPSVEFPQEAGLDLLGPVGDRYAFTTDLATARPLITPHRVALADDVGDDVPVLWLEDAWVVATVPPDTAPSRLERLLRLLGDVADLVDGSRDDRDGSRDDRATPREAESPTTDPRGFPVIDADAPTREARGGRPATSPADTSNTDVLVVPVEVEFVEPAPGSDAPRSSAPADGDAGDGAIDDDATPQDELPPAVVTPAPTNRQTFGPTAAGAAASTAAMSSRTTSAAAAAAPSRATGPDAPESTAGSDGSSAPAAGTGGPAHAVKPPREDDIDDDEADSWIDDPTPVIDPPKDQQR